MPILLRRREFLDDYFDYRPGEHLFACQKTGGGKTRMVYECADVAMRQNPQLRFASMMPKPRSPTTEEWARRLRLREVHTWPAPPRPFWQDKPRGLVVWPKHRKDLPADKNREQVGAHLKRCAHDQYWRGNSISFIDDMHASIALMDLNPEFEDILTAGREGGAAAWGANQKPSGTKTGHVSTYWYSGFTHGFFGRDNDTRNIERLSEIGGGVDTRELASIIGSLRVHEINGNAVSEQLYLDMRGPYKAIILPW